MTALDTNDVAAPVLLSPAALMWRKFRRHRIAYLSLWLTGFIYFMALFGPFMAPMAANLSEQDMADLGAFFASNKVTPGAVSEELVEAGQAIYRAGNKESGLPACMACHGPTGAGMPAAKWPALAGQFSKYTELQLNAFADDTRTNDPSNMMRDIAKKMTADEIKAVSAYVAGLH